MTPNALSLRLAQTHGMTRVGRVLEAHGTLVRASGVQARIGELCELVDPGSGERVNAEVIGIANQVTILTPLGPLHGISARTEVHETGRVADVCLRGDLLGRVVDAYAKPIDGADIDADAVTQRLALYTPAPKPVRAAADRADLSHRRQSHRWSAHRW